MLPLQFVSCIAHIESNVRRALLAGTSSVTSSATAQSSDLSAFLCLLPDTAIEQIAQGYNKLQLKAWTSELGRGYAANAYSLDIGIHMRISCLNLWLVHRTLAAVFRVIIRYQNV